MSKWPPVEWWVCGLAMLLVEMAGWSSEAHPYIAAGIVIGYLHHTRKSQPEGPV